MHNLSKEEHPEIIKVEVDKYFKDSMAREMSGDDYLSPIFTKFGEIALVY